jgi:DNA-binding transcriptional LysR family regulator
VQQAPDQQQNPPHPRSLSWQQPDQSYRLRPHPPKLWTVPPAGHPLAARASIGFGEVLDEPLVGVLESGALSLLLEEQAQRLGRGLRYRFRVASTDAARRLVAAGHGVTVMPDGVARPYEAALGLAGVPLAEPWARRRLWLAARLAEALPAPARLLRDHLLHPAPTTGQGS